MNDAWSKEIEAILPEMIAFRRDLHAHPELSLQEQVTGRKVREQLTGLPGLKVLPPLAGTDVVAILNPDHAGPCVGLRADMDALPIQEEADPDQVPYRSTTPGVMHACGHDGHTATLVAAAKVLSRCRDRLPGKVKFIFQPAEEEGGGAELLCDAGVMSSPAVDAVFALHGWPTRPVGTVSLRSGPAMASTNPFQLVVRGVGCHGAYPQRGIDPIVAASHIVVALQSIVARNVAPVDSAVVTIGAIHGGSATNIIPPECVMKGTLRYLRPEVGDLLRRRLREVVEHTAQAHGAIGEVQFEKGYPPVINDPGLCELVTETAADLFGQDRMRTDDPPSLGAEDFSFYGKEAPAVMFRLGVRPVHMEDYPPLHSPHYNFNDDALPVGVRMFCELSRRFLARQ